MKSYYGRPILTHDTIHDNGRYHSQPPTASPYPRLGFATQPKTAIAIISGTGKAMNFKFGRYIHRFHPNKSPLKMWVKSERGRTQGLPKFFDYPLLSEEWVKLQTSNFARTFIGSKAHEKFGIKGSVGVSRDCPNFFSRPTAIISGTGKATNFKFGRYIRRVHSNKSPLKFRQK